MILLLLGEKAGMRADVSTDFFQSNERFQPSKPLLMSMVGSFRTREWPAPSRYGNKGNAARVSR